MDSTKNKTKKDYTHIKKILDRALFTFGNSGSYIRCHKKKQGIACFGHNTNFCCLQQPTTSEKDEFYVIHHMNEFKRDQQSLRMKTGSDRHVIDWANNLASTKDDALRLEFYRIQHSLATIIMKDVVEKDGMFYTGPQSRESVDTRLMWQGQDPTPFTKLGCVLPDIRK
jgi:hypothetical protein